MKNVAWLICALASVAVVPPAYAQDGSSDRSAERRSGDSKGSDWRLHLSSGVSYVTRGGEFGRTNYYRVPIGARVSNGPFRLSATIPYVIVKGPGAAVDGDDELDVLDPTADGTRRGMGDLRLTGRYKLPKAALGGVELDLLGRVKVPTASRDKRLGTGEFDYAAGAELSREVGQLEPFVSAQYRVNGDRPDFDYRNTVAASVGTAIKLGRGSRASLSYDYSQSRIRGRSASHSLDAGMSARLSKRLTLSGSGSVGLSERAPDFGVGSTITWRAF